MEDAKGALEHIKDNSEKITKYSESSYNYPLYTWDDGYRMLLRCKECNSYILLQSSEFHSFYGEDSYYKDYFPVSSIEEAEELNRKYSGSKIEKEFTDKWLSVSNSKCNWINNK